MPIWEPGLEALVKANAERGRLTFTTDMPEARRRCGGRVHRCWHAGPARRRACRSHVRLRRGARACEVHRPGTVVVTKSTVPVGTGDRIEEILREEGVADVSVASNPEFLREGAAIADFKHPDRIVVGGGGRSRAGRAAGNLPALVPQPRADPDHRPPHRRAHQICGERVPRGEDQLHQRDRRSVRGGRCRRPGRRARHRPRQPHRRQVPARRARLWRQLLPQGHAGAASDRRQVRSRPAYRPHHRRGERRPQGEHGRARRAGGRRRPQGQARRGPRPRLQAEHRRHAGSAVDPARQRRSWSAGRRSARSTRSPTSRPGRFSRASSSRPAPKMPRPGRTHW